MPIGATRAILLKETRESRNGPSPETVPTAWFVTESLGIDSESLLGALLGLTAGLPIQLKIRSKLF